MSLIVSVSGVRGIVGETLTPEIVLRFAQAYGGLLEGGRVVLARDTRPSGEACYRAAAAGLIAAGCEVTEIGIAMTPTVGFTVRAGGFAGGISITASHNPLPWNGIKFFDRDGLGPPARQIRQLDDLRRQDPLPGIQTGFKPALTDDQAGTRHVQAVLDAREVDLTPLRGAKVVLDSVNGAGCLHTPRLLYACGCELVHLNAEPTGRFPHPPEPLRENLTQLADTVRREGAVIGFAQDPDADRLAIVDENGTYIGEEYTLALATESVLSRRPGPVAANLSTSRMIDDIAARYGVPVHRTPVGEANVARRMIETGCVIGGEGNGGVIDPRISYVRDSLSGISLVLQLMAATGLPLSRLVERIPRYVSIKQKAECPREKIEAAVARATRAFADLRPDTADGVRIDFPEGWVHLRASNTEPIVRLIAEARSADDAETLLSRVREAAGL